MKNDEPVVRIGRTEPRPGPGRVRAVLIGLLASLCGPIVGAADPPTGETLREIEQEGRRIVLYHEASDRAREHLRQETSGALESDYEVVVRRRDGWHVLFIKRPQPPSKSRLGLLLADARFDPEAGEVASLKTRDRLRPAPVDVQSHLKALQVAEAASRVRVEAKPPFEKTVLKDEGRAGLFSVYLKSRAKTEGTVEFGSDLLFRVSSDGVQVRGIEPLHATTSVVPIPAEASDQPTLHTHARGEAPTATDVALILRHLTLAPHLVLTPSFIYRIDSAGSITYLGSNEALDGTGAEAP